MGPPGYLLTALGTPPTADLPSLRTALLLAALAVVPAAARAQDPTQDQDLDFGDVFRGQAPKTISSELVTQTGLAGQPGQRGYFTVESSRDQTVRLEIGYNNPVHASLGYTGPETVMELQDFTFCISEANGACTGATVLSTLNGLPIQAPAFSAGDNTEAATRHVYVGATVQALADTRLGLYTGDVTLTAKYIGL